MVAIVSFHFSVSEMLSGITVAAVPKHTETATTIGCSLIAAPSPRERSEDVVDAGSVGVLTGLVSRSDGRLLPLSDLLIELPRPKDLSRLHQNDETPRTLSSGGAF
jgi:hypothetical protein